MSKLFDIECEKQDLQDMIKRKVQQAKDLRSIRKTCDVIFDRLQLLADLDLHNAFSLVGDPSIWQDWVTMYVWLTFPYDMEQKRTIDNVLKLSGATLDYTVEDDDKAAFKDHWKLIDYEGNEEQKLWKYEIRIQCQYQANRTGSTCVLVPLETKMVEKVVVYDTICPEGHPEMFDSEGNFLKEMHPLLAGKNDSSITPQD